MAEERAEIRGCHGTLAQVAAGTVPPHTERGTVVTGEVTNGTGPHLAHHLPAAGRLPLARVTAGNHVTRHVTQS